MTSSHPPRPPLGTKHLNLLLGSRVAPQRSIASSIANQTLGDERMKGRSDHLLNPGSASAPLPYVSLRVSRSSFGDGNGANVLVALAGGYKKASLWPMGISSPELRLSPLDKFNDTRLPHTPRSPLTPTHLAQLFCHPPRYS